MKINFRQKKNWENTGNWRIKLRSNQNEENKTSKKALSWLIGLVVILLWKYTGKTEITEKLQGILLSETVGNMHAWSLHFLNWLKKVLFNFSHLFVDFSKILFLILILCQSRESLLMKQVQNFSLCRFWCHIITLLCFFCLIFVVMAILCLCSTMATLKPLPLGLLKDLYTCIPDHQQQICS